MKKKVFYLLKELLVIPTFLFVLSIIICNFISVKSFNLNRNFLFEINTNIEIYLKSFYLSILSLIVLEYFISFKQADNHLLSRMLALFTVVILMLTVFELFIKKFNVNVLYITNIISIIVFQICYFIYLKKVSIKYPLFLSSIVVIVLSILLNFFIF